MEICTVVNKLEKADLPFSILAGNKQHEHDNIRLPSAHCTGLKLVLNSTKTEILIFTRSRSLPTNCTVLTPDGTHGVTSYKYLGIWLNSNQSSVSFFFKKKKRFSFHCKKKFSPKYLSVSIRLW